MSPTTTPETEDANWEDFSADLEDEAKSTKKVKFRSHKGKVTTFALRQLSQADLDSILEASEERGQHGVKGHNKLTALRETVRRGICEGPKGWRGSDHDLDRLGAKLLTDLGAAVNDFSNLPQESFRGI